MRKWIVPTLGRKKISTLKPTDVRTLRVRMTKAGRATSTVRQGHIVLSMILHAAVADRMCRTNVAKDVRKPRSRKGVVVTKWDAFSTEQAIALLGAAAKLPDGAGARWWFKVLAGPRQGEILGATLDDLDLDAWTSPNDSGGPLTYGPYQVNWKLEELRRDHGCGDDPCSYKQGARCPQARWRIPDDFEMRHLSGAWALTRPKSRTGRMAPLVPPLAQALRRHLAATADQPNPHGLIWHDGTGEPIRPKDDDQQWRELLLAADIITEEEAVPSGTRQTGHWARHTMITILAGLGADSPITVRCPSAADPRSAL